MSYAEYTPETVPWRLPATCLRIIDGDTQVYEATARVAMPEETVEVRRTFVVRILQTDTPERGEEGWAEATAFAREFLYDSSGLAKPVDLRISGRKDVYGRALGWALVDGVSLSAALTAAGLGSYRPLTAHLATLTEALEENLEGETC